MIFGCKAQHIATNHLISEKYNSSVWIPNKNEESYNMKVSDTSLKVVNLIFERMFDDSIKVYLNSSEIVAKKIKTDKNVSVVNEEFKIDYHQLINPKIEIWLIEKNKKISFAPKQGYTLCYLNRYNNIWSLEFSNYQRMYY